MHATLSKTGERQVSVDMEGIRDDHKLRYAWAAERIGSDDVVLDAGCGIGYGSNILSERAKKVIAFDASREAIDYASRYWKTDNINFSVKDAYTLGFKKDVKFDVVVAFEIIEHLPTPRLFLSRLRMFLRKSSRVFISVPNERRIRYSCELNPFHFMHYTENDVADLARDSGYSVVAMFGQDKDGIMEKTSGDFHVIELKPNELMDRSPTLKDEDVSNIVIDYYEAVSHRSSLIKRLSSDVSRHVEAIDKLKKTINEHAKKARVEMPENSVLSDNKDSRGFQDAINSLAEIIRGDQRLLVESRIEVDSVRAELSRANGLISRLREDAHLAKSEHEASISEKDIRICELSARIDELADEIGLFKSSLARLENERNNLANSLEQSKSESLELKDVLDYRATVIGAKDKSITDLSVELSAMASEAGLLSAEVARLGSERSLVAGLLEISESENADLKVELDAKAKLIAAKDRSIDGLSFQLQELSSEAGRLSAEALRLDLERKSLVDVLQSVESEVSDLKMILENQLTVIDSKDRSISDLSDQLHALSSEAGSLGAEVHRLESERQVLSGLLERSELECSELRSSAAYHSQALSSKDKAIAELSEQLHAMSSEAGALGSEIHRLVSERNMISGLLAAAEAENSKFKELEENGNSPDIAALCEELKEQVAMLRSAVESKDELIVRLRERKESLESAMKSGAQAAAGNNAAADGKRYVELQEMIHDLSAKVAYLSQERSVYIQANEELISEIARIEMSGGNMARKEPPSVGYLIRKLKHHRYYIPFLMKAIRNSLGIKKKRKA